MKLDVISYCDLLGSKNFKLIHQLENALHSKGIVGIRDVPEFENKTRAYINAARKFSCLKNDVKQQYAPNRDLGITEGYELGAEWFKNQEGIWQIDDKKASYYAFVPDDPRNIWPHEIDLRTPYLQLGELIFKVGKILLNLMNLNETTGLKQVTGYGRMLHYHKEGEATNSNSNWCGTHVDHGLFTGLIPAYYYRDGKEIDEPKEAGLHILPIDGHTFEKVEANDKSVLLFQVGEFGQLMLEDRIKATKHMVKKAYGGIERFAFALFYSPDINVVINSRSTLRNDARYSHQQSSDGSITYAQWEKASYERYRAKL